MTVLSDAEIESAVRTGSLVLNPFDPNCLSGAGYDLRLANEVIIRPGEHRLVATLERVELQDDMAGTLHIRSSLARAGILASLALVDPGFRGQLTISLFNAGKAAISMKSGERFVQIVLHRLAARARHPYAGKYQDSQGIVHTRAPASKPLCQFVSKVLLLLGTRM